MIAHHEAGHAVAQVVLGFDTNGIELNESERNRATARFTIPTPMLESSKETPAAKRLLYGKLIMTYYAGPCAEMAFSGLSGSPGEQGDRQEAWNLVFHICNAGYKNGDYVDPVAQAGAMNSLLEKLWNRTYFMVRTGRFQIAVAALAAEGLTHGAVGPERTAEIVATALLKDSERTHPFRQQDHSGSIVTSPLVATSIVSRCSASTSIPNRGFP